MREVGVIKKTRNSICILLTLAVPEVVLQVSLHLLLLSRFLQKNHIWVLRLQNNRDILVLVMC